MRLGAGKCGGYIPGLAAAGLLSASAAAVAQEAPIIGGGVEHQATTALAVMGLTAVPNETASTLFLDGGGSGASGGYGYQSGQIFGGFTFSDRYPLFFEGLVGGSRYKPTLVIPGEEEENRIPIKWTSAVATGGIGYDIALTENLALRPIFNFSLGYVVSDATLLAKWLEENTELELDDLVSDGLVAGGLGGALMLAYTLRKPEYDVDVTLRHTHMEFVPIAGSSNIDANATASSTVLWSRLRVPISDWRLMGNPVRSVWEASGSFLSGDESEALRTDWLGQVGAGIEFDSTDTGVPLVTRTRLVARYAFGEELEGYSVGLAVSF